MVLAYDLDVAREILGAELLWPLGHSDKTTAAKRAREILLNAPGTAAVVMQLAMLPAVLEAAADVELVRPDDGLLREAAAAWNVSPGSRPPPGAVQNV